MDMDGLFHPTLYHTQFPCDCYWRDELCQWHVQLAGPYHTNLLPIWSPILGSSFEQKHLIVENIRKKNHVTAEPIKCISILYFALFPDKLILSVKVIHQVLLYLCQNVMYTLSVTIISKYI